MLQLIFSVSKVALLIFVLCMIHLDIQAVIIRHDVDDKLHLTKLGDFKSFATIYKDGGHGVLIQPDWVITAAHVVFCLNSGSKIKIGDQFVFIKSVYSHPDYVSGPENDLALIQLTEPIKNIKPALLYEGNDELGQQYWIMGQGGTGNGIEGQQKDNRQNNGVLRLGSNRVAKVETDRIIANFDMREKAEPLEAMGGSGDSGTPAFIKRGDDYVIFGIGAWYLDNGFSQGQYGTSDLFMRSSYYLPWIEEVVSAEYLDFDSKIVTQKTVPTAYSTQELSEICREINF